MESESVESHGTYTDHPQPSAPSVGTIIEPVVLYHDLNVSTESVGGRRQDLDDTHIHTVYTHKHTHCSPPSVLLYQAARQGVREQ